MDDWLLCMLETNETVQRYAPSWLAVVSPDADDGSVIGGSSNEPVFAFHYYPHCYYSQKIKMILCQKKLKHHEHLVNINLGEQFHEDFLRLNPKGEVPVLVDKLKHRDLVDSAFIAQYLQDNYSADPYPSMVPQNSDLKAKHEELYTKLMGVRIEALTYGSVEFPKDKLQISEPKHPYNSHRVREQMRETIQNRTALLRTEAHKIEKSDPAANQAILDKIHVVHRDLHIIKEEDQYDILLAHVEAILGDCEVQLQGQLATSRESWLFCTSITLADVELSILLFRLWQLGYAKRMWTNGLRPNVENYYTRMTRECSFQSATGLESDQCLWPFYVAGTSFVLAIVAFIFYCREERPHYYLQREL